MATKSTGSAKGAIGKVQNNLSYLAAFIALIGYGVVVGFFGDFTVIPSADAGAGLFALSGEFFTFSGNIVTYAMGLSAIGGITAYVADPVTGELVLEKLSPAEVRERIDDAIGEIIAASAFIVVPAVKLFDVLSLWTDYSGTPEFAVVTMAVGVIATVVVVYLK